MTVSKQTVVDQTIPKVRMRWPDVAKGLSILGVVLLHIVIMVPGGMDGTAAAVTRVLDPLRMPLFFMVSGFFSAKVLNFTFRELFLRRLWFLLVPYVLWVPVELWLSHRVRATYQDIEMPGAMLYVMRTVEGWNPYWFLYGLILFNLVLWATRKWPPWAAMLVSFSPILLLPAFADMPLVTRVVMYLPCSWARSTCVDTSGHGRSGPRSCRRCRSASSCTPRVCPCPRCGAGGPPPTRGLTCGTCRVPEISVPARWGMR